MKKLLLLALPLMMVGCSDDEYARIASKEGFGVATFDSCEYIIKVSGYKGFLAHKGNCKYCQQRRKQEIKELIKELK